MEDTSRSIKTDLLVIDGLNLLFRNHHKLSELSNSQGWPSGALYGTLRGIMSAVKELQPSYLVVAAEGGRAGRQAVMPDYKSHRTSADEGVRREMSALWAYLGAWGVPVLRWEGYEADDVMAILARKAEWRNHHAVLLTEDHDLKQCLSPNVRIWRTMRRGKSDEWLTYEGFKEEYLGLEPSRYPEIQAMTGCSTDGIPGIKGIGEKTAMKFLVKHNDLSQAIEQEDKLQDHRDLILRNLKLTRMATEDDHGLDYIAVPYPEKAQDPGTLRHLLEEWEMKSLTKQFEDLGILEPTGEKAE